MNNKSKPKVVYQGKIFKITQEEIIDDKGIKHIIEKAYRPDVVTILGLTPNNELILIKEFRSGPKDYVLWLPGGKVIEGENFEETALREFEEETGYTTNKLELFHQRHISDNFHGTGKVFLAINVVKKEQKLKRKRDEQGDIEIIQLPLKDIAKEAFGGNIPNEFFCFLIMKLNYLFN